MYDLVNILSNNGKFSIFMVFFFERRLCLSTRGGMVGYKLFKLRAVMPRLITCRNVVAPERCRRRDAQSNLWTPDIAATKLAVAGAPPPSFVVLLPSTEQVHDPVPCRRQSAIVVRFCFVCSSELIFVPRRAAFANVLLLAR